MSKEEFLKIQTCVLKVNIHCDGCKQKVKKILQKIDGVFTTNIDSEQGKVTVSGNVDPAVLIKKLAKSAQRWPTNPSANPTSLQQLQQMKAFQDMKLPQMKDMKMPPNQQQQKNVKFALPEEDDMTDDEYDDEYDDSDEDELDDEMDDPRHQFSRMKQIMGNGPQGPNNMMMNGIPPQLLNAQKGAPNGGANGKKGGAGGGGNGAVPVQINMGGGEGKNGNGGKKGGGGGGGGGNNGGQNQGGKNGGGKPQDVKNGNNGGGAGGAKNGNGGNGNNMQMNGGKKGNNGVGGAMNDGFQKMGGPQVSMGQMGGMPMGQMGGMPMGQMGGIPAVQGLPAAAAIGGAAGGGANGYFQGAGPDLLPGNPYQQQQQQQQQQQYLAAMMNQQRAMGNERFQPMMYARPPPACLATPTTTTFVLLHLSNCCFNASDPHHDLVRGGPHPRSLVIGGVSPHVIYLGYRTLLGNTGTSRGQTHPLLMVKDSSHPHMVLVGILPTLRMPN
ncbi:hypothetical protein D5086_017216 [Populus alba]|uniref:Uncharacterized protein n=1 Tax=Populus alba TaxID=43335 RepID=A0ACC4BW73_POPAL